jgi:hypothetical protein
VASATRAGCWMGSCAIPPWWVPRPPRQRQWWWVEVAALLQHILPHPCTSTGLCNRSTADACLVAD